MTRASKLPGLIAGLVAAVSIVSSASAAPMLRADSSFDVAGNVMTTTFSVTGLSGHAPPLLGGFDFDFLFDAEKLSVVRVLFGDRLGEPDALRFSNVGGTLQADQSGSGEALSDAVLTEAGRLNLRVISLLESSAATCAFCVGPYLDELQSDHFSIAAVSFSGLPGFPIINANAERNGFALQNLVLADASGAAITADVTVHPAPEPATSWLLAAALGAALASHALRHRAVRRSAPANWRVRAPGSMVIHAHCP